MGRRADRGPRFGRNRADPAGRLRTLAPPHRAACLPPDACLRVLGVRGRPGGERQAHVLSTLRPDDGPTAWDWDLPEGAGTYRALFPRAWTVVDWDRLPIDARRQPAVARAARQRPGDELPGGHVRMAGVQPDRPADPGRPDAQLAGARRGRLGDAGGGRGVDSRGGRVSAGVVLRNPDGGKDPAGEFAIAATGGEGVTVTTHGRFAVDDGSELWADFAHRRRARRHGRPAARRTGGADRGRGGGDLRAGARVRPRSARFAVAWDFPVMRFGMGPRLVPAVHPVLGP